MNKIKKLVTFCSADHLKSLLCYIDGCRDLQLSEQTAETDWLCVFSELRLALHHAFVLDFERSTKDQHCNLKGERFKL